MTRRRFHGAEYTDLEKLRIEYFVRETRMSAREMAEKLGTRTKWSVQQYLWRRGISTMTERRGEKADAWAAL